MTYEDGASDQDRAEQRRVDPDLPSARRRGDPRVLGAVALGGMLGTVIRYALGRAFPTASGAFPWTTLVVNLTGSFLLGAFLAWLLAHRPSDRYRRPFVAIGFLGGYTTFSTAMVESAVLVKDGHGLVALAYLGLGLLGGLAAAGAGIVAMRRVSPC